MYVSNGAASFLPRRSSGVCYYRGTYVLDLSVRETVRFLAECSKSWSQNQANAGTALDRHANFVVQSKRPIIMPLPLVLSARATRSRGHWTSCLLMFALVGSNGKFYMPATAVGGGTLMDLRIEDNSKALVQYDAVSWSAIHWRRHLHASAVTERTEARSRVSWPQRGRAAEITHAVASSSMIGTLPPAFRPTRGRALEPERESAAPDQASKPSLQAEPALVGSWSSLRAEGFDRFLDKAMGLGWVKRSIAVKASQMSTQQQSIRKEGDVTHLTITDGRGTMRFEIVTDGRRRRSQGFLRLPIEQSATWASDGALVVEEHYEQHLGGERHGRPCGPGEDRPLVRTRRSVDAVTGEMVIEVERTIDNGETVQMRTFYKAVAEA